MNTKKHKHTGLYFGSFNPIHVGHLLIANYLIEFTDLDEIWFVVSPQNPLKPKSSLLAEHHRLAMVNIAIEGFNAFKASDIEFKLPKPSFTVYTLEVLREKYPDRSFSLIMGADNLQSLPKWKNYQTILDYSRIFVYPRPQIKQTEFDHHPSVTLVDAPMVEISSSFIRQGIKEGKNMCYFMHPEVFAYIGEMNFYKK